MRVAYLILAHIDAKHIARLTKKITCGTDNFVFIHVDLKSDINKFKKELIDCSQYILLSERVDVRWGGFSSISATINLMRAATTFGHFDRYVLLQGLEYPLKDNKYIEDFFEKNKNTEFILAQNISKTSSINEKHKYRLYHFLDQKHKLFFRILGKINSIFIKIGVIPHFKRNYVKDLNGKKMDIYQGCAQFGLTNRAIKYILNFHDRNSRFNKYFKTMYASDEAYFHTIIYNSPFISATPDGKGVTRPHLTDFENLTYFEYPNEVTIFKNASDWENLKNKSFLFFRKATSESEELLDTIDKIHNESLL